MKQRQREVRNIWPRSGDVYVYVCDSREQLTLLIVSVYARLSMELSGLAVPLCALCLHLFVLVFLVGGGEE